MEKLLAMSILSSSSAEISGSWMDICMTKSKKIEEKNREKAKDEGKSDDDDRKKGQQVDKFPNASYREYATYEEALIEWEKHTLARDSASSSRHVQTSVYAQEQRYPVRHNLDEDKEKLGETSIFSIYAFVLGSLFTILVFLVCIVAIFVGFSIANNM
ncbi:uncharacterized protein A4U43_C01F12970 [Asparagus officinalis]|uniref:Uncharacterized protein n=1 Tax=Asparagus officinalis TaxID=4686 RepID=A0A5P1FPR8_ASPOF|nr:uncharacterized protein A4U43_C01F12970 [Asparagus officinalis]